MQTFTCAEVTYNTCTCVGLHACNHARLHSTCLCCQNFQVGKKLHDTFFKFILEVNENLLLYFMTAISTFPVGS